MTSRTEAIQQLLALRSLTGASGSIHVWRRQRDGQIVGAYFLNDNTTGGAWVYNRKGGQIYPLDVDLLRRLVGGWKRRKCYEKLEHHLFAGFKRCLVCVSHISLRDDCFISGECQARGMHKFYRQSPLTRLLNSKP